MAVRIAPEDCCGQAHTMSNEAWDAFSAVTQGLSPDVTVTVEGRSWQVPRLYIACHGIKADEVPALAVRYGWPEVVTA
jgi:hypothetical protein